MRVARRSVLPSPFLIVAHPGHELRIHHWLELARPTVFVMTDGSGSGTARIEETRDVLARTESIPGAIFGPLTEGACYQALTSGSWDDIFEVARGVLREARLARPSVIVSDPVEGYNPVHDLTAAVAQAVCAALRSDEHAVDHWVFPLIEEGLPGTEQHAISLDAAALNRKVAAARRYRGLELEVEFFLAGRIDPARERFVSPCSSWPAEAHPFYEDFGRLALASGRFQELITYNDHVRPAVTAVLAVLGSC